MMDSLLSKDPGTCHAAKAASVLLIGVFGSRKTIAVDEEKNLDVVDCTRQSRTPWEQLGAD